MGGHDATYRRNEITAEKVVELAALAEVDRGAYVHMSRIYDGLGHWMNGRDAEALPWMAKFERNPWPQRIVWFQDDVSHARFYWLKLPNMNAAAAGQKITASVEKQSIQLEGDVPAGMMIRLSDDLLDLDREVSVMVNGRIVASEVVPRTAATIHQCLMERADLPAAATATLILPR